MKNICNHCRRTFEFSNDPMEEMEDTNYPLYYERFCSYECAEESGFIEHYKKLIADFYNSLNNKQKEMFKILFEEGRFNTNENYFTGYILKEIIQTLST